MNELVLPVSAGTLPGGSCPTDFQSLANLLAANFTITFPSSFTGIITSSAQPSDTTKAWAQLDSNGRFVRLYVFAQGHWLSPHQIVPGFVMIWPFALPDFTTFDGGDVNPAGPQSGPMWQQAQDSGGNLIMAPGFPIGSGTLPSGTIITPGSVGGEETHVLVTAELPAHSHGTSTSFTLATATSQAPAAGGGLMGPNPTPPFPCTGNVDMTGSGTGHNTLPPYYGVYFLQRTARLFFSV